MVVVAFASVAALPALLVLVLLYCCCDDAVTTMHSSFAAPQFSSSLARRGRGSRFCTSTTTR
jgi:hypothetical protein